MALGYADAYSATYDDDATYHPESLIISDSIELLGGPGGIPSVNPACAGVIFRLQPGYDLGAPQPTTDYVGSLILDGERPFGRRAGNRVITLPVMIDATAAGFDGLAAAAEVLQQAIDQQTWTLRWRRACVQGSELPLILDCFRARATAVQWGSVDQMNANPIALLTLTFEALPYGRADVPATLAVASPLPGQPPAATPVVLDSYSTVSGSNWVQSAQHVVGPNSARFDPTRAPLSDPDGHGPAVYSRTFAAVNISGRGALSVWAGFGTAYYSTWHSGPAVFAWTLTDSSGRKLSFSVTQTVTASNNVNAPKWQQVTASIPASATFGFTAVTGYSVSVTNRGTNELRYTQLYLDALTANPASLQTPASIRGAVYTLLGIEGSARAPVSAQFQQSGGGGFSTLIAHLPGPDAPADLAPFVSFGLADVPNGGTEYPVPSLVSGLNADFAGTYSIVVVANTWNSPSSARTLTITVKQYEYSGGPAYTTSVSRTFTPTTDLFVPNGAALSVVPVVVAGELTLPLKDVAPDNTAGLYTVTITDTNTSDRFFDALFLDTMGQTTMIGVPTAGAYTSFWLDSPDVNRDIGRVLASSSDRSSAISVMDSAIISGGPLTIDPDDSNILLAYCREGAPALSLTYFPHFWLDRTS